MLWALARALADGRSVMVVGEPAEAVTLLAGATPKALIVVTPDADPDAPDGTTSRGAPFRLRADWRERSGSIGLMLDGDGFVPPEEATRLLGASGLYLTRTDGPTLEVLPHRHRVTVAPVSGLMVAGDVEGPALGPAQVAPAEATLFVGAKRPVPPLPGVALLADAGRPLEPVPPSPPAGTSVPEAEPSTAVDGAAIVDELDRCRDELARRRAEDRRADLLALRLGEERGRFLAEIEALERRLADLEGPHAEYEVAESGRRNAEDLLEFVLRGLSGLALPGTVPPPPATSGEPVRLWLSMHLRAVGDLASESAAREAALAESREALAAARIALEAASERRPDAHPPPTAPASAEASSCAPTETTARLDALESMLEAVQQLRLAERAELARLRRFSEAAERRLAEANRHAEAARRLAAGEVLARAHLEETLHLTRTTLRGSEARGRALESLAAEHGRMYGLLTEALAKALAEREAAQAERRLADESLRRLRRERETP